MPFSKEGLEAAIHDYDLTALLRSLRERTKTAGDQKIWSELSSEDRATAFFLALSHKRNDIVDCLIGLTPDQDQLHEMLYGNNGDHLRVAFQQGGSEIVDRIVGASDPVRLKEAINKDRNFIFFLAQESKNPHFVNIVLRNTPEESWDEMSDYFQGRKEAQSQHRKPSDFVSPVAQPAPSIIPSTRVDDRAEQPLKGKSSVGCVVQ